MIKVVTFLNSLCQSNGFSLKEYPLNGRLLMVLLQPKIIIKNSLENKRKQALVKKAIAYLTNHPESQPAIFWDGEEQFFPL